MPYILNIDMRTLNARGSKHAIDEVTGSATKLDKSLKESQKSARSLGEEFTKLNSVKFVKNALAVVGIEETVRRSIRAFADYQTAITNLGKVSNQSFGSMDAKIRGVDASIFFCMVCYLFDFFIYLYFEASFHSLSRLN